VWTGFVREYSRIVSVCMTSLSKRTRGSASLHDSLEMR
jgi:hypothetical protein